MKFQHITKEGELTMQTFNNHSESSESDEQKFGRKLNPTERLKDRLIIQHLRNKTHNDLFQMDEHSFEPRMYKARSHHE
jgi:hypothetical protein